MVCYQTITSCRQKNTDEVDHAPSVSGLNLLAKTCTFTIPSPIRLPISNNLPKVTKESAKKDDSERLPLNHSNIYNVLDNFYKDKKTTDPLYKNTGIFKYVYCCGG